jgi:CheY-like chemotaxis protein
MPDRALVVDDDESTRYFLCALLRRDGWEVSEAEDGTGAMERVWGAVKDGQPFRLIILDVMMPQMDGFTTAERIRRVERERNVRRAHIIGFTGYPEYMTSEEALRRADFDRVTMKPKTPDELRELFAEARG